MSNNLTIHQTAQRGKSEGMQATAAAIRRWVKSGALPATYVGNRAYIYWPNYVRFIQEGGSPTPANNEPAPGQIRRIDL